MPKILVAPLDWGLGHATRCIPLIKVLLSAGCCVTIAASGATKRLLQKEFSELKFLELPGYNIRYSKKDVLFSVFIQIPRILNTIRQEKKWLSELLKDEHFDAVISDNRPGLYDKSVQTVYITHQLQIISGMGGWGDRILFKLHRSFFKRFNEVWVPDSKINPGLAGRLSHPKATVPNVKYIGPLSRLHRKEIKETKWYLMIILSGPEPQRSHFEKILISECSKIREQVLLVRGIPGKETNIISSQKNIIVKNHLTALEMEEEMNAASLIICRSGYTSVMDLICLGKKAILTPTPGQTEQEYLAMHLEESGYFPFLRQDEFTIEKVLEKSASFKYRTDEQHNEFNRYRIITDEWVQILQR